MGDLSGIYMPHYIFPNATLIIYKIILCIVYESGPVCWRVNHF
jgi:hypothetical protein